MWHVEFTPRADKQFRKLDHQTRQAVVDYLEKITAGSDPRRHGKPLIGDWSDFWRYRVGKFRLICEIQDNRLVVEVVTIGRRDHVYD